MKKLINKGQIVFGVAILALGVVNLFCAHFGLTINGLPWNFENSYANSIIGIALLAAGIAVAANFRSPLIAIFLGYFFLACALFHALPLVAAHPCDWSVYGVLCEALALSASPWVLARTRPAPNTRQLNFISIPTLAAPYLFAVTLVVFGSIHFIVAHLIASLIPAWIPAHLFFTYLTGTALLASAISIVLQRLAQWAGFFLGLMFLLWFLLLHLPRVAADPHNPDEWSSAFICLAMCGGSWIVANHARRLT